MRQRERVSIEGWPQLQAASILMQANISQIWVGPAGDTKSAVMDAMIDALGYECAGEPFVGTQCDPSVDMVCSIPVVNPDTGETELVKLPARAFKEALEIDARGGIPVMRIEELNTCSKLVQGALQTIVQSRFAGDTRLPASLRFIAVMNPPDIAPGAQDSMPPQNTRFGWLGWEPVTELDPNPGFMVPFEYWREASQLSEQHPEHEWPVPDAKNLPKGWFKNHIGAQSVLVNSYLAANRSAFRDKQDFNQVNKPSATPRTWTFVKRALAACESIDASYDVTFLCVSGLLGQGHATSFMSFRKLQDLANAEEIMRDGGPLPDESQPDVLFLMFETCAHMVVSEPTLDRWKQFMTLYEKAAKTGVGDYAYNAAHSVSRLVGKIPGAHKCVPPGLATLMNISKNITKFAE